MNHLEDPSLQSTLGMWRKKVEFSTPNSLSVSVTSVARCILLQRGNSSQARTHGKTTLLFYDFRIGSRCFFLLELGGISLF